MLTFATGEHQRKKAMKTRLSSVYLQQQIEAAVCRKCVLENEL